MIGKFDDVKVDCIIPLPKSSILEPEIKCGENELKLNKNLEIGAFNDKPIAFIKEIVSVEPYSSI